MNKDFKSILISASIILLYFYCMAGIIKLIANDKNGARFDLKVRFISTLFALISFIYIIGIYHIVGVENVDGWYRGFIISSFIGFIIGGFANAFIKNK
jgi:hypothetical protein